MKLDWTRKRTKLEKWQKSAFGSIPHIDLNSIHSEFALKRTQLEKSLAELGVERAVFWDGIESSHSNDTLLTKEQWDVVAHSIS